MDTAYETAEVLTAWLRDSKTVQEVTPAGSLRRGRETVGDLDLLVTGRDAANIAEHFVEFPGIATILVKGEDKVSVKLKNEMQVDVRMLDRSAYGAALQYFTGSKEHNVALRDRAKRQGWKLNEYGLFQGEKVLASRTEEEIYAKFGLPWIPPELRENLGEIEAAEEGKLPKLVELGDIRGDLQMHTTLRRPRQYRRNGGGGKATRLPVHSHHRPLQGRHRCQRSGRKTCRRAHSAHSRRTQEGEGYRNMGRVGSGHHGRWQLAISAVTLAELHFGVLIAKKSTVRAERLRLLCCCNGAFDALPIDDSVAASYGQIAAAVVEAGRQPRARSMDLLIAATAHAHGARLYTRNAGDFRGLEDLLEVIEV